MMPASSVISPNTSRSPMPTATSATHSVASNSSTIDDRNAIFSARMVVRRWASPNARTRAAGPCSRPSARRVGKPANRSSSCADNLVIVVSVAAARPLVSKPIRIMKTGMSGRVTAMMAADVRSCVRMTIRTNGVTMTASTSAGK
ncbi:unannotated protein [freshwater metagenome]|uniref:Unannotated protein n=1 Tax=freshwater metagenome TaxID=449393 RepID=A0A6J7H9Z7_9ZZZZ